MPRRTKLEHGPNAPGEWEVTILPVVEAGRLAAALLGDRLESNDQLQQPLSDRALELPSSIPRRLGRLALP